MNDQAIALNPVDRACCVVLSGDKGFDSQMLQTASMTVQGGGNRLLVIGDREPWMTAYLASIDMTEFYPADTRPPSSKNCVLFDGRARRSVAK